MFSISLRHVAILASCALTWIIAAPAHAADPADGEACIAAAAEATQDAGLPPGLLRAIGDVESGRRDGPDSALRPWPWTLNIAGAPHFYATRAAASLALRDARAAGQRSIDVGCFQVNLLYHGAAFAADDQALDPPANARVAAAFLVALRAQSRGWDQAVARYHSFQDTLGAPYRDAVASFWPSGADLLSGAAAANDPFVIQVAATLRRAHLPVVWEGPAGQGKAPSAGLPHVITPTP